MKKELALSAITAIMAVSTEIKETQQSQESIVNEATFDHYVTGCQCKSWRPIKSVNLVEV